MALTLTEANKLSNDQLQQGVVETIINESPLLSMLPFVEVVGTAIRYNRENTQPDMDWQPVGGTWQEDTPEWTEVTAALKILGGDADVDKFLARTRRDTNDLEVITIQAKAKAFAFAFEDAFWYGDDSVDVNQFDGMQLLCPAGQRLNEGATSTPAALQTDNIRQLIDLVKPGKPDALFMSRRTRRLLSNHAAASSSPVSFGIDEYQRRVAFFDDIPIRTSDRITDTETISSGDYAASTGGSASSIFAIQFGEEGVLGLNNGPIPAIEEVGTLESKDANRWRVKGYVGLALMGTTRIAILDGISSAAVNT